MNRREFIKTMSLSVVGAFIAPHLGIHNPAVEHMGGLLVPPRFYDTILSRGPRYAVTVVVQPRGLGEMISKFEDVDDAGVIEWGLSDEPTRRIEVDGEFAGWFSSLPVSAED